MVCEVAMFWHPPKVRSSAVIIADFPTLLFIYFKHAAIFYHAEKYFCVFNLIWGNEKIILE